MNIELNHPPNLERLVLFCIDADFCNQILILQRFSRSTIFTYFCTAQISKFQQKSRHNFGKNESIQNSIHSNFRKFDMKIAIFLLNFHRIQSDFHRSVATLRRNAQIYWEMQKKQFKKMEMKEKRKKKEKIAKKSVKIPNDESDDNIFSFRMNNSIHSLVSGQC